jgi:hypothetical protein
MSQYFLVGAVLGSALFIFAGRAPAERLLAAVRERIGRR